MPNVQDLLQAKGDRVVTIGPAASVLAAARTMNKHRIGSLVVMDEAGHVAGIFTERDVLTRIVAEHKDPETTSVEDAMTTGVVTCRLRTTVDELKHVMRQRRIRHVPVVEDDHLVGIVSIGDLNQAEQEVLEETIRQLEFFVYRP